MLLFRIFYAGMRVPTNCSKSDTVLNFALIYHLILQSTTSHNDRLTPRFLTVSYLIIVSTLCLQCA